MAADEEKHAVDFWQKETHYYESRAREQGARASAAIIVACTVLLAGYSPLANIPSGKTLFLALVPVAILTLWSLALRHLAEMLALEAYGIHAEERLAGATRASSALRPYRPWSAHGGKTLNTSPLNGTVLVIVGAVSIVGTFGLLLTLVESYPWVWGELAFVALAGATLGWGARWMYRNRTTTLAALRSSTPV